MTETPSFRVSPQQEQLWVEEPDGPTGQNPGGRRTRGDLRGCGAAGRARAPHPAARDPTDDLRPPRGHSRAGAGDPRFARAAVGDVGSPAQCRGRAKVAARSGDGPRSFAGRSTSSTARSFRRFSPTPATRRTPWCSPCRSLCRRRIAGGASRRSGRLVLGRAASPANRSSMRISPHGSTSRSSAADRHAEAAKAFWQRVADAPRHAFRSPGRRRRRPRSTNSALPVDADRERIASPTSPRATARRQLF